MKTIEILQACLNCGMPLHYDAIINDERSNQTAQPKGLCLHCHGNQSLKKAEPEKEEDHEWLLKIILDLAKDEQKLLRKGASLIKHIPFVNKAALGEAAGILSAVPRREAGSTYDAMVLYSGGKDSTYMLIKLAKMGLKVCAWMLDPGYQSPQTISSAKKITALLNVPLIIEEPKKEFTDSLFRTGFSIDKNSDVELQKGAMTYGSACWPCFSLIAVSASRFANKHRIPLCFIGTQKGQNRLNLDGKDVLSSKELPKVSDLVTKFVTPFKQAIPQYVDELLVDPEGIGFPTALVPYYELVPKPSKEAQIAYIEEHGWVMPKNTGACSSNCMINELGRAVMRSKFGFDLYQVIDANERRLGYGADKAASEQPNSTMVKLGATMLGLNEQEINQLGIDRYIGKDNA